MPEPAVELTFSKTRACLAQDFLGLPKRTVLALDGIKPILAATSLIAADGGA